LLNSEAIAEINGAGCDSGRGQHPVVGSTESRDGFEGGLHRWRARPARCDSPALAGVGPGNLRSGWPGFPHVSRPRGDQGPGCILDRLGISWTCQTVDDARGGTAGSPAGEGFLLIAPLQSLGLGPVCFLEEASVPLRVSFSRKIESGDAAAA